jgi:3',5'-cyclic-AMP phosphodiesterase
MQRILHITDLHLRADAQDGLKGVVTLTTLRAVLADAATRGPFDLVAVTGDLVHDEPTAYVHLVRELAGTTPVYCIPGNHDEAQMLASGVDGSPFHVGGDARLGRWLAVFLDSTVPGAVGGALAPEELDRLAATLEAHRGAPTVVFLHHPPVALGSRWLDAIGLSDADRFFAVLDRHEQVRAVAFGHAHQAFEGRRGRLPLLGTPSTCVQFLPGADDFALDDRPPGYRIIELQDDGTLTSAVVWLASG